MFIKTARCIVRFEHAHSEEFKTTTGLNQGSAFTPILFNITLEVVTRSIYNKYKGIVVGKYV
jgi:hypothetical protein